MPDGAVCCCCWAVDRAGANPPQARPAEISATGVYGTHVHFCSFACVCVHVYLHACVCKEQGCYLQPQASLSGGQQSNARLMAVGAPGGGLLAAAHVAQALPLGGPLVQLKALPCCPHRCFSMGSLFDMTIVADTGNKGHTCQSGYHKLACYHHKVACC